jgi:hypothetical protein
VNLSLPIEVVCKAKEGDRSAWRVKVDVVNSSKSEIIDDNQAHDHPGYFFPAVGDSNRLPISSNASSASTRKQSRHP